MKRKRGRCLRSALRSLLVRKGRTISVEKDGEYSLGAMLLRWYDIDAATVVALSWVLYCSAWAQRSLGSSQ